MWTRDSLANIPNVPQHYYMNGGEFTYVRVRGAQSTATRTDTT